VICKWLVRTCAPLLMLSVTMFPETGWSKGHHREGSIRPIKISTARYKSSQVRRQFPLPAMTSLATPTDM